MKILSSGLVLLFVFSSRSVLGDNADLNSLFQDLDNTQIFLHTVDQGHTIFTAGGHMNIRIQNLNLDYDRTFNWANIEHKDPLILYKFLHAKIESRLSDIATIEQVEIYRRDPRDVQSDLLNLSSAAKRIFLQHLKYWHQDTGHHKFYHYFKQNCSTNIRDILDLALSGKLKQFTEGKYVEATLRQTIGETLSPVPPIALLIDFSFGKKADNPLSLWDSLFLPKNLRNVITQVPGLVVDSRPFLIFGTALQQPGPAYTLFALAGAGSLFFSFFLWRSPRSKVNRRKFFSLAAILAGVVTGTMGLAIWLLVFYSRYEEGGWNLHLLLFSPLNFLLVWWGLRSYKDNT